MSNKPEREFRVGQVKATIWSRERIGVKDQNAKAYSVSIQKSYQDDNGNWKNSTSFFPDDLPKLQLVLAKAYEYVMLKSD